MNAETLLEQVTTQCDQLRVLLQQQTPLLDDLGRRLLQITQQLRKNIDVRNTAFADDFNMYVKTLRATLDHIHPSWEELRTQVRQTPEKAWNGDLALPAKGLNSRAKMLSRACDEFTIQYDRFCKLYKNFTAAKLNVWLLTSCHNDLANLTGKVLFLARELARKTDQNREPSHD